MTRSTNNAFTSRLCILTGDIKPEASLKATQRVTQLFAISKAQREKLVLMAAPNGIDIPTKESDDKTNKIKHVRI